MSLKTSSEYSDGNKQYVFKNVFISKEPIVSSNIGFLSPKFNSAIYSHSLLPNNTIDYNIKKPKQSLRRFSMKDNNSSLLEKVTNSVNKKRKAKLIIKKPTDSRTTKSLRNTFSHSMYSMKSSLSNSSSQNTIKSHYNKHKTISSSLLEETPIKPIKTKTLKSSLSTVYDNSNILRFCRTPVKNTLSNIKGRLSQNDDKTLRYFRKKLFLNQSLATIEKEGDALEQVIQYNIKKDEQYHSKISSMKEIILEKKGKEYMELYKDFNIKLYLPNKKEKQFKDVNYTIDYLKQLNSKVAYSQRYFFAKKIGLGWNEKYQFKRKDRYKVINQQGTRPDEYLI